MQYLLTEAEFNQLTERKAAHEKDNAHLLQTFCTRVANELPVHRPWSAEDRRPWGCILTPDSHPTYCDECPSQKVCPYPHKEWSK
jgi:hypothetical protein